MSDNFHFFDYVKVNADSRIGSLDKKDKLAIIDKSQKGDDGPRGLIIDLDLTHSGRRINNRLYSYPGQKAGLPSLTRGKGVPVLKNHDDSDVDNCIGRFIGGEYVDLTSQLAPFFRDIKSLQAFQRDYLSDDPEKMYQAMKRHNLLTNRDFPGLGAMRTKLRVTDPEAIEKFLDERYVYFSASHASDRYVCSICQSDWMQDGPCEHRPGRIYDGDFCVHTTGIWRIKEGSVVNTPADDLAFPHSMTISDTVGLPEFISDPEFWQTDSTSVYITDSTIQDLELNMTVKPEEIELLDPRDFARKLVEGVEDEDIKEFTDALMGETVFEINYLIRVHDSLHHAYDWELWYGDKKELSIPTDVFKLHGHLHDLSTEKDFRGSLINGVLDGYGSNGSESEEYKAKMGDSDEENPIEDSDPAEAGEELAPVEDADTPAEGGAEEVQDEDPNLDSEPETPEVDPKLVEALFSLIKDRLTETPEPTPEPEEAKDGEAEATDGSGDDTLAKDYEQSLKLVDEYKANLESVLLALAELKGKEIEKDSENKLEELWDWFGTIDSEDNAIIDNAGKIEDPSDGILDGETEPREVSHDLKGYEKKVVDTYQKIFEDQGEDAASAYFSRVSRYVPRGFHPSKFQLSEEK
jgi:hypothetical protein